MNPLRRLNAVPEALLGPALFSRRSSGLCVLIEKAGEKLLNRVVVSCVNKFAIRSHRHHSKLPLLAIGIPALFAQQPPPNSPFVPSTTPAVETMLKLAGVTKQDVVYDLGCGDGRIVIAAAKTYGAHGVGIDIDPKLIRQARAAAKKAHVEKLVRFELGDLFKADIHDATVVTVFLLRKTNELLRPKLLAELRPGTRVVANTFDFGDWKPEKEITFPSDNPEEYLSTQFFLWTIPTRP
jgi:SAM-dependent methyltransferase